MTDTNGGVESSLRKQKCGECDPHTESGPKNPLTRKSYFSGVFLGGVDRLTVDLGSDRLIWGQMPDLRLEPRFGTFAALMAPRWSH